MTQADSSSATWSIHGVFATCSAGDFAANVEIARPERGISPAEAGSNRAWKAFGGFKLLGTVLPGESARVADCYARGGDLVVTYEDCADSTMRYQLYWRVRADSQQGKRRITIDLEASAQTPLLDARPEIWTVTRAPRQGPVLRLRLDRAASSCWMIGAPAIAMEMAHPDDFDEARVTETDEGPALSHRLFGDRLEKGVILRSRVRAILCSETITGEDAETWFNEFAASPIPLTT